MTHRNFAREAILKAAAHIEQHPESYDFMRTRTPAVGDSACLLGWIGHFMGMGDYVPIGNVAEALGFKVTLALDHCFEFYNAITKLEPARELSGRHGYEWNFRADVAARAMRKYAETF